MTTVEPRIPSDDADSRLGRIEAVLTTQKAIDVLAPAYRLEGRTLSRVRRNQVIQRPGESITAQYLVTTSDRTGREREETVVASAAAHGCPEGALVVECADLRVGVYRWTHDPALPGLKLATDRSAMSEALPTDSPVTHVRVRSYRPFERAVVHLTLCSGRELYLKVVPPSDLDALATRHRAARDTCAPVPPGRILDKTTGLFVMDAVEDRRLREALDDAGDPLPSPDRILAVCETLGRADVSVPAARRPPLAAVAHHGAVLESLMASSSRRIRCLLERLGPDPGHTDHTIHGDLHPGQILLDDKGAIAGLIDLDDLGRGHTLDDLGTFLGHLMCSIGHRPSTRARQYVGACLRAFETVADDPAELHSRSAAIPVGLAAGPHRAQRPRWRQESMRRLALAERFACGDVRSLRSA